MRDGVDIVVGTPAKVWDFVQQGRLDLSMVHFFILDEGACVGMCVCPSLLHCTLCCFLSVVHVFLCASLCEFST